MYCPVCKDEYRSGFTRCATCNVDLVEAVATTPPKKPTPVLAEVAAEEATANFCGFFTLDEARQARDKVRAERLRAEILICEPMGARLTDPVKEEYWLRVTPHDFRAVAAIIGFEPGGVTEGDDSFLCSACGDTVRSSDAECPGCGLRFEE